MKSFRLALLAFAALIAGCVSLYPVEPTPEGILRSVAPGDTVKIATRDGSEMTLQVRLVTDFDISGRLRDGEAQETVRVPYDRIETMDLERPNVKKAMLTTLLPAVIGAVILCNNTDCTTRSVLTANQ